jgi:aromatic ring-cleaving dioxygenase
MARNVSFLMDLNIRIFHTHIAYYTSSLQERTEMRSQIGNKYAQTFYCEKYKWNAI